jgi:trehalose utilization protein
MTRTFATLCIAVVLLPIAAFAEDAKIRVVVWDSQQPTQKKAYKNFLGNRIAEHLKKSSDLDVRSVTIHDPQQGLSDEVLDNADVLIMWVHVRKGELSPELGKRVLERVLDGKLAFAALHSSHWASPFIEAMNWRTRENAKKLFPSKDGEKVEFVDTPPRRRFVTPKKDSLPTPRIYPRKFPGGKTRVEIVLPNCCFPGYRPDGKPSFLNCVKPDHPIARGVPREFRLPHTEMYNEPFHVPDPDEVIFEERWPTGEWFRSAAIWNIGKGKVFYFRPGHETYGVFHEKPVLKIVENAARYLGAQVRATPRK